MLSSCCGGSIGATVPIVGLVIPVGVDPNLQYWSEALESVAHQTLGVDRILVVSVVKKIRNTGVATVGRTDLNQKNIVFECSDDSEVTTFQQVFRGFEFCQGQGLKYVSVMSANDALSPKKLAAEIETLEGDPAIRVSYPTVLECDDQLYSLNRFREIAREVTFNTLIHQNFICDCSTVTLETFREVPFDPGYGRASFWIWWFRIWDRYGSTVFRFHPDSAYHHRDHVGQLSSRKKWIENGKRHINEWLKEWAEANKGRTIE